MDSRHYDPQKLADARKNARKTQQEVAEALNIDRQTVYRAEAGVNASYELLAALGSYYRIPMTEIIRPFPEPASAV